MSQSCKSNFSEFLLLRLDKAYGCFRLFLG